MKKILFSLIFLLIITSVSALNLEVEKQSSNEVMILDLNQPAIFDLEIKNLGPDEDLIFYTFFTTTIFPKGTVPISTGATKEIKLEIYPPEKIKTGYSTFNYFIRSQDGTEMKETLLVNIVKLDEVFELGAGEIDSESKTIEFYLENKVNFNFKNVDVDFSSSFVNVEEEFAIGPYERKNFSLTLDKEDFKKLMAGFYTLQAEVSIEEIKTNLDTTIKFNEKNILTESKKDSGLIINTQIIEKTNEGNLLEKTETVIKKGTISRLFTTFSPEPGSSERDGSVVYYTWYRELRPGETLEIKITTNWIIPFLIILLIIAVVVLTKIFSNRNLILRKRVQFVKAKGGEFALKVSIIVNAKKYIERVNILDKLPPLVKLHEKFGVEKPSKINEKLRRLEWNFEKLEAGEVRILNYVIYSKIGVLGKFALPETSAIYERDGKVKESSSNRAFFVAEQRIKSGE